VHLVGFVIESCLDTLQSADDPAQRRDALCDKCHLAVGLRCQHTTQHRLTSVLPSTETKHITLPPIFTPCTTHYIHDLVSFSYGGTR
jgi:hypothetical protein